MFVARASPLVFNKTRTKIKTVFNKTRTKIKKISMSFCPKNYMHLDTNFKYSNILLSRMELVILTRVMPVRCYGLQENYSSLQVSLNGYNWNTNNPEYKYHSVSARKIHSSIQFKLKGAS